MDGATGYTLFRTVQIPMIRSTLVVVLTTIMIMTLKIFDIVCTMTNGNFNTDVLARQMYDDLFVTNQSAGARRSPSSCSSASCRWWPTTSCRSAGKGRSDDRRTHPFWTPSYPAARLRSRAVLHGAEARRAVRSAFSSPIASVRRHPH